MSREIRDSGVAMLRHRWLAIAGLLLLVSAPSLAAQAQPWQNQWYWGGKGGLVSYTLPTLGTSNHPQAGGEWLVTASRAALYVGYSTSFTGDIDNFSIPTVPGTLVPVQFTAMQRYQLALLVLPWNGHIQPYAGGGFVIEKLNNAVVASTTLSSAQITAGNGYLQKHTSGAFLLAMGGLQIRIGKAAIFGQAQFNGHPGTDFILAGSTMSFEAGIRYAFLGSREDDVTTKR
jgi:hypothetical protein